MLITVLSDSFLINQINFSFRHKQVDGVRAPLDATDYFSMAFSFLFL